jgi:peptidoglycan biosynthesis protein MviN/MurJ (putative lipid II flippase)
VKLYLVELPFNVVIVWSLTKYFGIAGAALSYSIRTVIETLILWCVVYRIVPFSGWELAKKGLFRPSLTLIVFGATAYAMRGAYIMNYRDIAITLVVVCTYALYAYRFVFDEQDRAFGLDFYLAKKERLLEKIGIRQVIVAVAEESLTDVSSI